MMQSQSITFFILSFLFCTSIMAQPPTLEEVYEDVKDPEVTDRFTKHSFLEQRMQEFAKQEGVGVQKVGASLEGRNIYCLRLGTGDTKVLMWSQMHGDEPTATMALLDLFQFFSGEELAKEWKSKILSELSIYIVPMLNPDGAERFTRRNAAYVDLNRDALRLQNPEGEILKHLVDSLQPDFGFNLHDQSIYYTAGDTRKPATFSFLAPAFNEARDINSDRKRAMQLIGSLNHYVQDFFPGQVGRYSDAFEPRAFGDNITKWGTATILIECGGLKGDREKQEIRKVHFGLFLHAFECMAEKCYRAVGVEEYESIPPNRRELYDLVIRNLDWPHLGREMLVDLAFRSEEFYYDGATKAGTRGVLHDLGDLSTHIAYTEFDATGYRVAEPKIYPRVKAPVHWKDFNAEERKAVNNGYGIFLTNAKEINPAFQEGPVRWVSKGEAVDWKIAWQQQPTFYLKGEESGELEYILNNGRLFDLGASFKEVK